MDYVVTFGPLLASTAGAALLFVTAGRLHTFKTLRTAPNSAPLRRQCMCDACFEKPVTPAFQSMQQHPFVAPAMCSGPRSGLTHAAYRSHV